jgi:hypothetical protein
VGAPPILKGGAMLDGYRKIAQIGKVAFYEKEGTIPLFNKSLKRTYEELKQAEGR